MLINKIDSANFKAMYTNKMFSYSSDDRKVISDIKAKLMQPYSKDSKGRSYVSYLEEAKGVDVIFNKNPFNNKIRVEGHYETKKASDGTLKSKDKFFIGEYDDYSFSAEDAIVAHKKDMNGLLYRVLIPLAAISLYLATFFAVAKTGSAKSNKNIQDTVIVVKDTVSTGLKKVK